MNIKQLIENIERLLKEQKKSKGEMYKSCGFSSSAVSQWKSGMSKPALSTLERIAEYFGTSVDVLVGKSAKKDPADMSIGEVDEEVMQIASEIFSNPSMRDLFSAVNGASADQIRAITAMIKNFKKDD